MKKRCRVVWKIGQGRRIQSTYPTLKQGRTAIERVRRQHGNAGTLTRLCDAHIQIDDSVICTRCNWRGWQWDDRRCLR